MLKTFVLVFLFLVIFASFTGAVTAQSNTIGVSVGDKFTYSCTLQGTHNASLSWDPWMPERNQSTWEVTITNINDTRVTYQLKIFLTNGTEEIFPSQFLDLNSGGSNGPNYFFFTYANINVSNLVYPSITTYIINDTSTRTYESGPRAINHINFVSGVDLRDAYIDKTSGAMVELSYTYIDLAGTFRLKLTYSSLWTVSSAPSPTPTTTVTPTTTSTTNPTTSPTATQSPTQSLSPSPTVPEFPKWMALGLLVVFALVALVYFKRGTRSHK